MKNTNERKEMRIGNKMRAVASLVAQQPGHPKMFYAKRVGPYGSLMYGYAIVDRAIRAGLVKAEFVGGKYKLS